MNLLVVLERTTSIAEVEANWAERVGDCFSEGALYNFLVGGPALFYHTEALNFGRESEVRSIALVSRDEHLEKVRVEVAIGDEVQPLIASFHINTDGLFYKVVVVEEDVQ